MGFFLFILVNAALFLRPSELVQGWETVSIYEPLIISCFLFSLVGIISLAFENKIARQPLTLMVFGLLLMIVISGLGNLDLDNTWPNAFEFAKVLIYYLLLITTVNTPQRLRQFLFWVTIFAGVITLLAVLQYH